MTRSEQAYDVVVVGSGPGGEGAAMKCAKGGKSVCVVEKRGWVGGACTHAATIPSKTLRQVVQRIVERRRVPGPRTALQATPSFGELTQVAASVIERQVDLRQGFYDRNRVSVVHGTARLLDARTVQIDAPDGGKVVLGAGAIVLAPGSRPYHPPNVPFGHARIFDAESILALGETPVSLTVYGAGVIGCEYASIFRNLGVKVNLVNTRDKLLSFLDDEIIDALSYHLSDQGVLIRHNEQMQRVETRDDSVVLHLESGKRIRADLLLWANGRTGNTAGLGVEGLGIGPDERGNIPVNEAYQTSVPSVYAVGDVVGYPSLASAAYDQGRLAGTHIVEGRLDTKLARDIPTGIYTTPEVSSVGRTERELTAMKVPFEVGRAHFRNLARAQITGQTVGMLKLLFHRDTLELLGIHAFGDQASEIIHIGQAIMSQEGAANTLQYFVDTTFNYPTMAEAYRVASLNGLNRVS
ncbi:MAG: Si-specific NAD(P)(+) transhydrogenase [Polyangiaceae bacterium]|nr:Si-specific NAD(P)(+) transhydrogenase [Polyangiaceae bacterium]